jgi:hypothetical protein
MQSKALLKDVLRSQGLDQLTTLQRSPLRRERELMENDSSEDEFVPVVDGFTPISSSNPDLDTSFHYQAHLPGLVQQAEHHLLRGLRVDACQVHYIYPPSNPTRQIPCEHFPRKFPKKYSVCLVLRILRCAPLFVRGGVKVKLSITVSSISDHLFTKSYM